MGTVFGFPGQSFRRGRPHYHLLVLSADPKAVELLGRTTIVLATSSLLDYALLVDGLLFIMRREQNDKSE